LARVARSASIAICDITRPRAKPFIPASAALTGIESIESVRTAVLESIAASGDPAVAVIPEGPYVVPFCRKELK
jgi:hypothetical protein